MKNSILSYILLLFATSLYSQAPQAFNYQGVARDLSGNPITQQNIGLRVSILKSAANGSKVYTETHDVTTTGLGLFTAQIGEGLVTNGVFSEIDWGSDIYFLQFEMDESGGNNYELIGTSQLMSVPYALYAENGVWDRQEEDILFSSGNVLIEGDFNESDAFRYFSSTLDDETGDTLRSQIGFFNFNNNWQSNSYPGPMISFVQGQLGIPYPSDRAALMRSESALEFRVEEVISGGPGEIRMLILENGNVGIGNTPPASKLQISDGDIYIDDINKGVIMRSPNGQCWRMTVNNSGQPEFNSLPCPN